MQKSGNILSLKKLLGHSSLEMTMRYAHLAPDFLRKEMELMEFD
jgi:integrase